MATLGMDIEVFYDLFYVAFKRFEDGRRIGFEYSTRTGGFDRDRIRNLLLKHTIVTYNGLSFDMPLLWWVLEENPDLDAIKRASDRIIKGNLRWWDVPKMLGIRIPRSIDHIDLVEPQPNPFASLKALNARLHGDRLQDLPYDPDHRPNSDEMDAIIDYCLHSDLDATHRLWDALQEPIELREKLGEQYGQDFRSKSDAQIGEAIIKKRVEEIGNRRLERVDPDNRTAPPFRYNIPEFIRFETPQLQAVLDRLRETEFVVNQKTAKVDLPKWLEETPISIGGMTYSLGIGGLHSTEANRALHSDEKRVLIDADVASYYPAIIINSGLYPAALGKDFLTAYKGIRRDRLVAKKNKDKTTDKALKIALNGAYGKLGSRYSALYAPHLLITVTLTGQLSLLMLIERAERAGIPVVSGNTDGIIFHCPREHFAGIERDRLLPSTLAEVTEQWERDTGFDLEFTEYASIYNHSVNSYYAFKPDGSVKQKGPFADWWWSEAADLREQMTHNPTAMICCAAALERIRNRTPVAETIRSCRDIRRFVTVINATGGATWRDQYLGRVVRYYWSTDGDYIVKRKAHPKTGNRPRVPKTEGSKPVMDLPETFPDDIDYARYEAEAEAILTHLGFYGTPEPPMKRIRITRANRMAVLSTFAMVA